VDTLVEEAGGRRGVDAAWSIGVDFGTAFSKAAATRVTTDQGGALREMTPLRLGEAAGWDRPFLIPSSIYLDRARVHFGHHAVTRILEAEQDNRELARSFKTVLGAHNFEGALDFYPTKNVDPDRVFRLRDLIVLFLAYLLALIERAAARAYAYEPGGVIEASRICFSRPGWIPSRVAATHDAMMHLFSQAHLVNAALGAMLLDLEGVEYSYARAALDGAAAAPSLFQNLDGGIYEASAVGLCHLSDKNAPKCLLVVDVGGGTTDIAGLMRAPGSEHIRVVRTARRTIDVAGDDFDAALLDYLIAKSSLRGKAEQTALWRRLLPRIRDLKEEIFERGSARFSGGGVTIRCSAGEFERQPSFRAVLKDIIRTYDRSLDEVLRNCRRERIRQLGVVIAGGGSRLPALRRAVTRPRWNTHGVRIVHLPTTPRWGNALASAAHFDALFAQLSAAFGAAISSSEFSRSVQV